jgi:hypothetical protein
MSMRQTDNGQWRTTSRVTSQRNNQVRVLEIMHAPHEDDGQAQGEEDDGFDDPGYNLLLEECEFIL